MIPELREALYQYLITPGNSFIAILGDGKLFHKRPLNNENFPYCTFEQTDRERSIDSSNKFETVVVTFSIYDGSNDGVRESTISADRLEQLVEELDNLLDLKDQSDFSVANYSLLDINRQGLIPAPSESNSVIGAFVSYTFLLQKGR